MVVELRKVNSFTSCSHVHIAKNTKFRLFMHLVENVSKERSMLRLLYLFLPQNKRDEHLLKRRNVPFEYICEDSDADGDLRLVCHSIK